MLREAALALFLIAVALGLWLADVRPLAVVGVMALALAVAWVIEWVSWREDQLQGMPPVRQEVHTAEVAAEPPPITAEPQPVAAEPAPVAAEPVTVPEPVPVPAPRARGLWLRRPKRAAKPTEPVPEETPEEVGAGHTAEASEGVGAGHAPPGSAATPEPDQTAAPEPESHAAPEEPPPSRRRLQPVQSAAPPPPAAPEPPAPQQPPEPQGAPIVPLWARSSQP